MELVHRGVMLSDVLVFIHDLLFGSIA